jgi:hypothetical protein
LRDRGTKIADGSKGWWAPGWWVAVSLCYPPVIESVIGGRGTVFLLLFAITYRHCAAQLFVAGAVFGLAAAAAAYAGPLARDAGSARRRRRSHGTGVARVIADRR